MPRSGDSSPLNNRPYLITNIPGTGETAILNMGKLEFVYPHKHAKKYPTYIEKYIDENRLNIHDSANKARQARQARQERKALEAQNNRASIITSLGKIFRATTGTGRATVAVAPFGGKKAGTYSKKHKKKPMEHKKKPIERKKKPMERKKKPMERKKKPMERKKIPKKK
jgi:hypothetical protein